MYFKFYLLTHYLSYLLKSLQKILKSIHTKIERPNYFFYNKAMSHNKRYRCYRIFYVIIEKRDNNNIHKSMRPHLRCDE